MSIVNKMRRGTSAEIAAGVGATAEYWHNTETKEIVDSESKLAVAGPNTGNAPKVNGSMGVAVETGSAVAVTTKGKFVYEDQNRFEFVMGEVTVLAPATVAVDEGANLNALDSLGAPIDLVKDTVYVGWLVVGVPSNFILASRGQGDTPAPTGGVEFSDVYDGINNVVKDITGTDIEGVIGEYVYSDGDAELTIVGSGGVIIDKTTPEEVVASAYDTSGNGGRRLLYIGSDYYSLVTDGFNLKLYKNTSLIWSTSGYTSGGNGSIATDGVNLFVLLIANNSARHFKLNLDGTGEVLALVDSGWTDEGAGSLTVASNGDLHACWSSVKVSYPNSFNVSYSKSVDGGVNWSSVTQVTILNTIGQGVDNLSICIKSDGYPYITAIHVTTGNAVVGYDFNGSVWSSLIVIHNATTYIQANTCVDVLSDGALIVAWNGKDSTDSAADNIRFSKSVNSGANWSTMEKLTAGNTVHSNYPSISRDVNDAISIMYQYTATGEANVKLIQGTSSNWSVPEDIADAGTGGNYFPNLCNNFRSFDKPLTIFRDNALTQVSFYGKWSTAPTQVIKKASEAVIGDDVRVSIAGPIQFSGAANGARVTGFKSILNLID